MKKIVLFILLITVYACSGTGSEDSEYEMINLIDAFSHPEELSVKDLGEHISYVPLETTDESLIGERAYIRILKDKLLVGSFLQPIKMFDKKTGRFIRTIGNIGQGANEYTLHDDLPVFWTDDRMGIIYVKTDGVNVLRFDVDGNPMTSIYLPEDFPPMRAVSQVTTDNKLYVYNEVIFNKNDYKVWLYDIENEEIQKYCLSEDEIIPLDLTNMPVMSHKFGNIPVSTITVVFPLKNDRMIIRHAENPCLWVFDRQLYFKENFNDTIYRVSADKLNPELVFNLGDRHWTYEDRHITEGNQNKILINYILEGKKTLFFAFQTNYYHLQEAKTYLGVYNKVDKSVKVTDKPLIADPGTGFFDGMLQTATADGQFAGLIEAISFMENMNHEHILTLSEDDNPIAVIIE